MKPSMIAAKFRLMQKEFTEPGQTCHLKATTIATLVLAQSVEDLREELVLAETHRRVQG
jgi:hypothetical protein